MRTGLKCVAFAALGLVTACGPIRVPGAPSQATPDADPTATEVEVETVTAPAQSVVEQPVLTTSRAVIDWDSARRDFAARTSANDENLFTVSGGGEALSVPVLLPDMPITTASAGEGSNVQFRPMDDGYYAVYPGETYDMIINGTDRLHTVPGRTAAPATSDLRFEETMTGAQVAFSRYGASYLVEFACKDAADNHGDGCITEADAKATVQDLLLAGTQ